MMRMKVKLLGFDKQSNEKHSHPNFSAFQTDPFACEDSDEESLQTDSDAEDSDDEESISSIAS